MKLDKKENRITRSLFSWRGYLMFFALVSFIVSCCFVLFINALQAALNMKLEQQHIEYAAKITFINVMFLSLLCTVFDGVRRKITVERPVKRILKATQQLMQGDFSARIEPLHGINTRNEFDAIIEDFNKMAQEVAGIESLRTDFIANVSHELKTPLAVMQNYATLLQAPELSAGQRMEYAGAITDATHRLTELITNILRLDKLENQQIFPQRTQYDLSEQLRECILCYEDAWEQKDIQIVTELKDDVNVYADAELLMLVWNNLISNAVKFTSIGGSIKIALRTEGECAVVTVSDTGCGMSAQAGRHIFEKFYQGDESHSTQGNGLGLALVKRVVDIIGGKISVNSRINEGSEFTVSFRREAV